METMTGLVLPIQEAVKIMKVPEPATFEVTLHQSSETKQFSDHASIRNDLRETTTKIPTTTTMTTETTKVKSNITTEVGLLAAADDLPPKKKRCSLLQDANARSACYSDNYLDFPAKPEIICTERELQDTQLRSLCANYQVYASTTEAATTVRPNNGCRK